MYVNTNAREKRTPIAPQEGLIGYETHVTETFAVCNCCDKLLRLLARPRRHLRCAFGRSGMAGID